MAFDQLVEQHHKLQFSNNFMLATQQTGSKFRAFVTERAVAGEGAVGAEIIGKIDYRIGEERKRSNIENVPARTRRWLVQRPDIETGQYFDSIDQYRMIADPKSELIQAHRAVLMRGIDDMILGVRRSSAGTLLEVGDGGILGAATEGKRPTDTSVNLPAANVTAVGGTGLTLTKLRAARQKLAQDENMLDTMGLVMAITPKQHDDLLGVIAAAGGNLNLFQQQELMNGQVTRWMGITFIETNRLPLKSGTNNVRLCPIWDKSNVVLGVWQDLKTDMWNDTHAANTPYMRASVMMDCVRVQDSGVHVIECQE